MDRPTISPVTGIIAESNVIFDFGKHEGRTVEEIRETDPDFYESLIEDKILGAYAIKREAHIDGKLFRLYLNPLAKMDQ